jgi:hypothetical protein
MGFLGLGVGFSLVLRSAIVRLWLEHLILEEKCREEVNLRLEID